MRYGKKKVALTAALVIWMTCFGELPAFADVTGTTVPAGEAYSVEVQAVETEEVTAAGEESQKEPEEEPEKVTEAPVGEITEEAPVEKATEEGPAEEIAEESIEAITEEETTEEIAEESIEAITEEETTEEIAEEKPAEEITGAEPQEEISEEEPEGEISEEEPEGEISVEDPVGEITDEASQEEITGAEPSEKSGEQATAAVTAEDVVKEAKAAEDASENKTSSITEDGHILAFASDLHGLPDVLENAMSGFPENTEYVSLIGDLVGSRGGDAPEYNSEDVYEKIRGIFGSIKTDQVSIIWADHDANVHNQDNLVRCEGGYESGQIYEGKNSDGSTAYYIYGIGYYHMKDGGSISQTAAEEFKEWVKDKDVTIPILVLCHVPIQAKRGDNNGAPYWNEALNYAATGVEGISTEENQADIIRNVLYLCGHNHTVDQTEYVFPAGTHMLVQIDASGESQTYTGEYYEAQDTMVFYSVKEDEEYADLVTGVGKHHKAEAKGVVSNIFYTSMIPGYLKTSGNASIVSITEELIRLSKYNGGQPVSLGTDGSSDAIMDSTLEILRIKWGAPDYLWTEDLSSVTASRALTSASSYTQSETVTTVSKVTREASCEENGLITYIAVFGNSAFAEQVKTQVIPALGHNWGDWVITKEATATQDGEMMRTCRNDPSHVETKVIPATGKESEKKKPDPDKKKESENNTEDSSDETATQTDTDTATQTDTAAVTQTNTGAASKSAPTGDEADFVLWIVLAMAAAGGLAAAVLNKRKI